MMEDPLLMEDHEEFPQLGTEPPAVKQVTIIDSDWVNLPRPSSSNTKLLRHCASSPDMRIPRELPMLHEQDEDDAGDVTEMEGGSGDDSFTVISKRQETCSGGPISFRDAILVQASQRAKGDDDNADNSQSSSTSRPRIRQAKYVVVQTTTMTRCAKSTGDLRLLSQCDSEVMGETDAMDFYHRKALGAKGRVSGLRLRPDEAKRKEMTMNKKNMQRAGQS